MMAQVASFELKDVRKSYGAADVIKGIDLSHRNMASSAFSSAPRAAASPRFCG